MYEGVKLLYTQFPLPVVAANKIPKLPKVPKLRL